MSEQRKGIAQIYSFLIWYVSMSPKLSCINPPTLFLFGLPPNIAREFYPTINTKRKREWMLRLLSLVLARPFSSGSLLSYKCRICWLCWRVGGLTAGIALKRQLGFHSFKVLIHVHVIQPVMSTWLLDIWTVQRHWRDVACEWTHFFDSTRLDIWLLFRIEQHLPGTFSLPQTKQFIADRLVQGCGSDVDAHWYSLSSDPNPYWETSHASQSAIKAYWKHLATKYSLSDQLVLNRQVISVDWNNERQLYKVQTEDVKTKEVFFDEVQAVISAIGTFCVPHYPAELRSIEAFEGEHFHSARWDHSVDLHNKRVAVIGNSCSAFVLSFASFGIVDILLISWQCTVCPCNNWGCDDTSYQLLPYSTLVYTRSMSLPLKSGSQSTWHLLTTCCCLGKNHLLNVDEMDFRSCSSRNAYIQDVDHG